MSFSLLTKDEPGTEIPFIFLKSNRNVLSSNVNNDVIILAGSPVPFGYRGVIADFNLNFSTVAGTVKWVSTDFNANNILSDIVSGITASSSGVGATVLEAGERLAVAGQVAGAGIFSTFCTGKIVKL